jgi:hypothetical protein
VLVTASYITAQLTVLTAAACITGDVPSEALLTREHKPRQLRLVARHNEVSCSFEMVVILDLVKSFLSNLESLLGVLEFVAHTITG